MSDEPTHRHGAFFGRRKGHPLRARQAELFETLLPRLAVDLTAPAPDDLATLFPAAGRRRSSRNRLRRRRAPDRAGAGRIRAPASSAAEPFVNGMAKALAAIDDAKLANIRLHHADAIESARLAAGGLDRAGRSALSRSVAEAAPLEAAFRQRGQHRAARARPAAGGEFRFATDWANYAEWTLAAPDARARFHLDGRARRRLAQAVAGVLPARATRRRRCARAARPAT